MLGNFQFWEKRRIRAMVITVGRARRGRVRVGRELQQKRYPPVLKTHQQFQDVDKREKDNCGNEDNRMENKSTSLVSTRAGGRKQCEMRE